MAQAYMALMEAATADLIVAFDVTTPPVPAEIMLQRPKAGMWQQVNLSELSAAFINVRERYSPRMSIARLLVRYICRSAWGSKYQLAQFQTNEEAIRTFARVLLMPYTMIAALNDSSRNSITISNRFEVPEHDAQLRLIELGYLAADKGVR
ncbi:MAG: hypothetical protein ACYDBJ_15670 [Aggregatilineales bacterium]